MIIFQIKFKFVLFIQLFYLQIHSIYIYKWQTVERATKWRQRYNLYNVTSRWHILYFLVV